MPGNSTDLPIDWQVASNLIQTGKFEQATELLQSAQLANEAIGNSLAVAALAAARQICLACLQSQADVAWYQQASDNAVQRQDRLQSYVQAILEKINGQRVVPQPESNASSQSQPISRANTTALSKFWLAKFWGVLRQLLHRLQNFWAITPATTSLPAVDLPAISPLPVAESVTPVALSSAAVAVLPEQPTAELHAAENQPISPDEAPPQPTFALPSAISPPALDSFRLVVYCFGAFRVYQNDQMIEEWNGLKGQAVLKYLVAQRGASVVKDILMDLFWPGAEAEAARRNLHQAIYSLRQTLRHRDPGIQHIYFENNQYSFNPELSVWLDLEEFETRVNAGHRLHTSGQIAQAMVQYGIAEGLYQGDFLADDLYEEWPRPLREQLRNRYLAIADRLSETYLGHAEYSAVIAICHKILSFDNCFEEAHRRLMHCYLAQGQRHLAVRQYQTCVQALTEELDVPPSVETKALYEQITNTGRK